MTTASGKDAATHRGNGEFYADHVNALFDRNESEPIGLPAEARQRAGNPVVRPAIEYRRITCAELDTATYDLEYLIPGVLVAHQPCILAGPKKTLKTSVLIDLAISLAMGGYFLGRLKVARACRVGVMTGESGLPTIQETARRECRSAGYRLRDIGGLVWSDQLPQFGSIAHEEALRKWLTEDELEVVAIDPAYLCVSGGEHGDLFDMGAMLRGVSEVCQDAGAMLILCHHNRKTGKTNPYDPPELEDIAWSGFQEFARQWLLLGRRAPYIPGTGEHRLWLSAGGSAGHSELWGVDIAEGRQSDPGGRTWQVSLATASEVRERATTAAEARKAEAADGKAKARIEADKRAIVKAMLKLPNGDTGKVIRERAGLSGERFNPALAALLESGEVVPTEVVKGNHKTPYDGYRLRGEA